MSELKPCPFCNGELLDSGLNVTFCRQCGGYGPHPSFDMTDQPIGWNLRPREDALQARYEQFQDTALKLQHEAMQAVNKTIAENKALTAQVAELREALESIRGWREIGCADYPHEYLREIENICDAALSNTGEKPYHFQEAVRIIETAKDTPNE